MPGTVKTTETKTLIADVPSFSYADGRDSLVLAAQAAGRALGRDASSAMLKGLSALAFRLMFPTDWRRYTPDALCGFDHTALLFDPLGLRVESACFSSPTYPEVSQRMIVESIRKGYPVLAQHLMEWEDWGVIAGFGDNGEKLYCRTPHDGSSPKPAEPGAEPAPQAGTPKPYARHKHWPDMLLVVTGEQPVPDRRESIRISLRTAIELYDAGQFGPYCSGKQAYLNWIEGLRDSAWYADQGEPEGDGYVKWVRRIRRLEKGNLFEDRAYDHLYLERAYVNSWRVESLIDARTAASSYLNTIAQEYFKGAANEAVRMHLQQAAIRYNWLVARLVPLRYIIRWDDELDQAPWTQAIRNDQEIR